MMLCFKRGQARNSALHETLHRQLLAPVSRTEVHLNPTTHKREV